MAPNQLSSDREDDSPASWDKRRCEELLELTTQKPAQNKPSWFQRRSLVLVLVLPALAIGTWMLWPLLPPQTSPGGVKGWLEAEIANPSIEQTPQLPSAKSFSVSMAKIKNITHDLQHLVGAISSPNDDTSLPSQPTLLSLAHEAAFLATNVASSATGVQEHWRRVIVQVEVEVYTAAGYIQRLIKSNNSLTSTEVAAKRAESMTPLLKWVEVVANKTAAAPFSIWMQDLSAILSRLGELGKHDQDVVLAELELALSRRQGLRSLWWTVVMGNEKRIVNARRKDDRIQRVWEATLPAIEDTRMILKEWEAYRSDVGEVASWARDLEGTLRRGMSVLAVEGELKALLEMIFGLRME